MVMENFTSSSLFPRIPTPLHSGILDFHALLLDWSSLIWSPFHFWLLLFPLLTLFYQNKFRRQLFGHAQGNHKQIAFPLPPGPKPWPVVGCLPQMLKNQSNKMPAFRWIHKLMEELNTEIACIRLGNVHVIPVISPEISREFLKKQDAIFSSRPLNMSSRITSKGFLTTALVPIGDQWKKMKRVMATEVLSPARHRWLHWKRLEEADHLVRYVYNQCNNNCTTSHDDERCGLLNVRMAAQHYCGNVIRKLMFGARFFGEGMEDGGPGVEEKEHVDAIFTILNYLFAFCSSDYLPCLTGIDLDGHEKIIKQSNEIVNKYHDPIIEERIQQWRNGATVKKKMESQDLLDVLIAIQDSNGNPLLSTEEIKAQVTEIMIAAVDNPSNAAEWALAEMINQPETLEKAVEELDRVVGKERLVQESDFSQLNYVKACAREAFRLHPIAPFNVPHVSTADATVSNYFIPKGSHVLLSRLGLGRNPKVWDEPLKFKPERHLNQKNLQNNDQLALVENDLRFISFSTGRRGCIGINLGTAMTVMLFARLLQGFSWSAPPNHSSIDLTESEGSLALAKPLLALAKPRLPAHLYPN